MWIYNATADVDDDDKMEKEIKNEISRLKIWKRHLENETLASSSFSFFSTLYTNIFTENQHWYLNVCMYAIILNEYFTQRN